MMDLAGESHTLMAAIGTKGLATHGKRPFCLWLFQSQQGQHHSQLEEYNISKKMFVLARFPLRKSRTEPLKSTQD